MHGKRRKRKNRALLYAGELDVVIERDQNVVCGKRQQDISRRRGLEQSVLQGCKRQVQGSNGLNPAQPRRPWGSTQTIPSRRNEAQRPRRDGRAVVKAWGTVHVPMVVSREGRIRLLNEKGPHRTRLSNRRIEMRPAHAQTAAGMGPTTYKTTEASHYPNEFEEGDIGKDSKARRWNLWKIWGKVPPNVTFRSVKPIESTVECKNH